MTLVMLKSRTQTHSWSRNRKSTGPKCNGLQYNGHACTHTYAHAHTQHSTIRAGVVGTHHHRSHGTQARLLPPERMRSCAHLRLCEKLLKYLFDEISASNSVGGCSLNNDDVHLRDKRFPIVNKSEFSLRFITKLFFIVYEVRIFLGRKQK